MHGVLEHQRGRELAVDAQRAELHADQPVGLLRQRAPLLEHGADLIGQGPRAPRVAPTQLGVELAARSRSLIGTSSLKCEPAQLSPQCGDNSLVGKRLGELDHPAQVLLAEATAVALLQLSPRIACSTSGSG